MTSNFSELFFQVCHGNVYTENVYKHTSMNKWKKYPYFSVFNAIKACCKIFFFYNQELEKCATIVCTQVEAKKWGFISQIVYSYSRYINIIFPRFWNFKKSTDVVCRNLLTQRNVYYNENSKSSSCSTKIPW